MADVIAKLKLESGEFDSKVQRAVGALKTMERECRSVDGTLAILEKDQKEYVQSLGRMETVSNTLRGKINELSSAYVELRSQYNRLTDEEKQGDFGKALSASLQQLKERVDASKKELADINNELKGTSKEGSNTGGVLSQLADKFVVNIDAMKLFNVGLSAVKGALGVAKDAFFASEQNLDEWGRIVDSSESLYRGFLNALNTGDISGYLTNIGNIVQAARNAYNALDELNTFNAFNQVNVEKTRTGMTEAIVDYREGNGSKESVRAAGDAYKKELEKRRKLEKEAYLTAVRKIATERGINYQDLLDAMSGSYGNYTELKKVQPSGTRLESTFLGPGMAPSITQVPVAVTRQEKLGEALRNLNDTELQSLQALGAQAERTGNEIAQVDRQLVRVLNGRQGGAGGGTGGSGGGSKEVTIQQQIAALEREALTATAKRQNEIRATIHLLDQELARQKEIVASLHGGQSDPVSDFWKAVNRGDPNASLSGPISTKVPQGVVKPGDLKKWEDYYAAIEKPLSPLREMEAEAARLKEAMADAASPEQYQQLNAELAAVVEKMSEFKGENVAKAGEDATESWRAAASAIQSVGSALGSIEDPAAKVMSIIAQAIATIALSYAQASSMAAKNPANAGWGWIAFAATGAATMISSIAAIKSATAGSYAEGGIVPGRSFTGDNLTANVNSGEVILSVAQANTIASILQGGGSQQSGGTPYVTGEQIYMGLNNYLRRTGRGELITAR